MTRQDFEDFEKNAVSNFEEIEKDFEKNAVSNFEEIEKNSMKNFEEVYTKDYAHEQSVRYLPAYPAYFL